jgi:hypothetical protein
MTRLQWNSNIGTDVAGDIFWHILNQNKSDCITKMAYIILEFEIYITFVCSIFKVVFKKELNTELDFQSLVSLHTVII